MRILILNQFFHPDISATSQLMTDLAEDLAKQGAEVTSLCCNVSYVGGKIFAASEMYGAVRIERVSVVAFDRENILRRISSYLSFYVAAFFRILRLPKQDVILVLTTPPLVAIVAYAIRLVKGSRVAYLVQDLYPDIAYAFGMLRQESLAGRMLDAIALFLLERADVVIALGVCMRERLLAKGVAAEKVHVIPNWADGTQIEPIPRASNPFRASQGLGEKFIVLYSGNMGRAHDFTPILKSMEQLQTEKDIVFLFIGGGPKKAELNDFLEQHPGANVRILDYVPREDLRLSMGAADISIVAVADGLDGLVVPSKLYGIMASGRPVLYVGPASSEAARTIGAHKCGFVVSNADAEGFSQAILTTRRDTTAARAMGEAARRAFEQKFDRRVATRRYFELLAAITKV